ncbi:MAG: hypothetical protein RR996_07295 [Alistipes sp.]
MKKICYFLLCIMCFTSCVSRGSAEKIEGQRDSLATALQVKDSLLSEVFTAVNGISENLSAIKARENILTLDNGEGAARPVEQINSDIAAIDNLLQENRARIEALERSSALLRKANVKIKGLEQMISSLNAQISSKNTEIVELKAHLSEMGVKVETLSTQVSEQGQKLNQLSSEKTALQADVADKTVRLYTVYYIIGSQKELIEAQIIRKSGFIGRTLTVNDKRNLNSFTQSDTRFLQSVPVGHKNVSIVTTHPEDSYRLVEGSNKEITSLQILDPERFWESSKILVISYK